MRSYCNSIAKVAVHDDVVRSPEGETEEPACEVSEGVKGLGFLRRLDGSDFAHVKDLDMVGICFGADYGVVS